MTVFLYERVLQLLEAEGIKTLFGIPDPSFFHMFNRATDRGWQVIAPHHEEAGAFMAEATWRMTGIPGVVVGNQGPGVANLVPAAINAAKENAPMIFIGGQRAQIAARRVRRGRIQYTPQWRYFEEAMKYTTVVEYPEQLDEIIHEAFRQALTGTPGPVYIEIPMNAMMADLGDLPAPLTPAEYRLMHQPAPAQAINSATDLIRAAKRPIMLVGQGAFTARAHESLAALADNLQCPIIHTYPISSFLPGSEERTFPCGFSPAGAAAVSNSDLVIAIGSELGEPIQHGVGGHWAKGCTDRKWIYIERDPQAFGVNRFIDVPLLGDLRDVVPQLVDALQDEPRAMPDHVKELIEMHRQHRAEYQTKAPVQQPLHPGRMMVEATRHIPEDAVFVRDGGATSIYTWTYAQVTPEDSIWNQNFGHLGTGLPYAIGAQLAVGNQRRVFLVSGDSAFLFHTSELETAVRKNLPVICIVSCDYAWGVEVRGYRGMLGEGTSETEAHWGHHLRLDKVAEGYGAHGEYVEREEDIGPAIQRALASGKPAVIQIPVDGDANARDVPGHEEYSTWYNDFWY
ncbi:thiamine pyrophosphate-binding protein [Pseudomaricurvus sp. HS19]|uniref:thiamine pyrophosphate-binding protein n=1 Tax=Pseudomaricurvus sp. HS19 TaxID=2692626 RepID=UPI00136907C9|nr:thiamine pyrophosphate-binding protein [Pseudomaricurvus sp. HS19]MYM62401.1 thiamine pyrophosphate-binding protein [Pseudomaricurvus sp. HS19]